MTWYHKHLNSRKTTRSFNYIVLVNSTKAVPTIHTELQKIITRNFPDQYVLNFCTKNQYTDGKIYVHHIISHVKSKVLRTLNHYLHYTDVLTVKIIIVLFFMNRSYWKSHVIYITYNWSHTYAHTVKQTFFT